MTYGDGPTFDGMGQIISGELTEQGQKYRRRIRELEAEVVKMKNEWATATDGRAAVCDKLRAERDQLRAELALVGEGRGCCDHGCLVAPPVVGTNAGKCYCSQSKVRGYIYQLREALRHFLDLAPQLSQLLDGWHQDGTAWSEWDESVRSKLSEVHGQAATLLDPPAPDKGGKL
jgi:hypothetical protein